MARAQVPPLKLDIKVKRNKAAQDKNLKKWSKTNVRGTLAKISLYTAQETQKYMFKVVHKRTWALAYSLQIFRKDQTTFVVRPSESARAAGKGKRTPPYIYGAFENARGGSHAFVDKTMKHTPVIARQALKMFKDEIDK